MQAENGHVALYRKCLLTPEWVMACGEQRAQWKGFSGMEREKGSEDAENHVGMGTWNLGLFVVTKKIRGKKRHTGQFLSFVLEMTTDSLSVECVLGHGLGSGGSPGIRLGPHIWPELKTRATLFLRNRLELLK